MDKNNLPSWYESTQGPKISETLTYIAGNLLPIINLALASHGVNIMPENVNTLISIGVFIAFSAKAAYGYAKSKKVLGAQINSLYEQNTRLQGALGQIQAEQAAVKRAE